MSFLLKQLSYRERENTQTFVGVLFLLTARGELLFLACARLGIQVEALVWRDGFTGFVQVNGRTPRCHADKTIVL